MVKNSAQILIFLLVSFSVGWFGRSFMAVESNPQPVKLSEGLIFSTENFEYLSSENGKSKGFLSLTLSLPHFSGANVSDIISNSVRVAAVESLFPNILDYEGYLPVGDILLPEFLSLGAERTPRRSEWELTSNSTVIYNTPPLLSLEQYSYQFTGGAHGNEAIGYSLFSTTTGNSMKVLDLFKLENFETLLALGETEFRKARKIPEGSTLDSAGFQFGEKFKLSENIGLTESGIILYYNAYEISSYATGPTEVVLDSKDLEPLLKDEYKGVWK
jgi:hypothetical protein